MRCVKTLREVHVQKVLYRYPVGIRMKFYEKLSNYRNQSNLEVTLNASSTAPSVGRPSVIIEKNVSNDTF